MSSGKRNLTHSSSETSQYHETHVVKITPNTIIYPNFRLPSTSKQHLKQMMAYISFKMEKREFVCLQSPVIARYEETELTHRQHKIHKLRKIPTLSYMLGLKYPIHTSPYCLHVTGWPYILVCPGQLWFMPVVQV